MPPPHPSIDPLRDLLRRLQAARIEAALGGSGLLYALGLAERISDWDLTTDAEPGAVRMALTGFSWEDRTGGQNFESAGRYVVHVDGEELDLISRSALRSEAGITRLPTIITGWWQGLSVHRSREPVRRIREPVHRLREPGVIRIGGAGGQTPSNNGGSGKVPTSNRDKGPLRRHRHGGGLPYRMTSR